MIWIAVSTMWAATAAAAMFGVYVTSSGWCLLVMLLPSLVTVNTRAIDEHQEDD